MRAVRVEDSSQVAEARRTALTMAGELGFGEVAAGRVAIVATELATNLLKHAGSGEILVGAFDDGEGAGLECIALDRGPGLANRDAAMRDGHSSAGSPGTGLGAIVRQSQEVDIYSQPGVGVAVLARLYPGSRPGDRAPTPACLGAVSLPKPGEEACGDAWTVRRQGDGMIAMVVDGLGHGPLAATAAQAAVTAFEAARLPPSADLIARLHLALRSTRGAAASVVRVAPGEVEFIGVGNVAGVVVTDEGERRMVCYNGTLGHAVKTVRAFAYPTSGAAIIVLASDGLSTSWSLDAYPGLQRRHPSLIAAVLYRDFSRRRDDVTVLVIRPEIE